MDQFENFMLNHWPHLISRVARLEGMVAIGLAIGAAILGIMIKGLF